MVIRQILETVQLWQSPSVFSFRHPWSSSNPEAIIIKGKDKLWCIVYARGLTGTDTVPICLHDGIEESLYPGPSICVFSLIHWFCLHVPWKNLHETVIHENQQRTNYHVGFVCLNNSYFNHTESFPVSQVCLSLQYRVVIHKHHVI